MFVSSERNQVLASKYHVESLVAPCKPSADSSLHAQSRCSAGRSVDTQGVIYLRLSPPLGPFLLGGGRHSDPSGAGLCLVHMWLSVGAPRSASRGPALPSRQPAPDTGRSEGLGAGLCSLRPIRLLRACATAPGPLPLPAGPQRRPAEKRNRQTAAENTPKRPQKEASSTTQVLLPMTSCPSTIKGEFASLPLNLGRLSFLPPPVSMAEVTPQAKW